MEYNKPWNEMQFLVFILANVTIYNHAIFLVIIYVVFFYIGLLRESSQADLILPCNKFLVGIIFLNFNDSAVAWRLLEH